MNSTNSVSFNESNSIIDSTGEDISKDVEDNKNNKISEPVRRKSYVFRKRKRRKRSKEKSRKSTESESKNKPTKKEIIVEISNTKNTENEGTKGDFVESESKSLSSISEDNNLNKTKSDGNSSEMVNLEKIMNSTIPSPISKSAEKKALEEDTDLENVDPLPFSILEEPSKMKDSKFEPVIQSSENKGKSRESPITPGRRKTIGVQTPSPVKKKLNTSTQKKTKSSSTRKNTTRMKTKNKKLFLRRATSAFKSRTRRRVFGSVEKKCPQISYLAEHHLNGFGKKHRIDDEKRKRIDEKRNAYLKRSRSRIRRRPKISADNFDDVLFGHLRNDYFSLSSSFKSSSKRDIHRNLSLGGKTDPGTYFKDVIRDLSTFNKPGSRKIGISSSFKSKTKRSTSEIFEDENDDTDTKEEEKTIEKIIEDLETRKTNKKEWIEFLQRKRKSRSREWRSPPKGWKNRKPWWREDGEIDAKFMSGVWEDFSESDLRDYHAQNFGTISSKCSKKKKDALSSFRSTSKQRMSFALPTGTGKTSLGPGSYPKRPPPPRPSSPNQGMSLLTRGENVRRVVFRKDGSMMIKGRKKKNRKKSKNQEEEGNDSSLRNKYIGGGFYGFDMNLQRNRYRSVFPKKPILRKFGRDYDELVIYGLPNHTTFLSKRKKKKNNRSLSVPKSRRKKGKEKNKDKRSSMHLHSSRSNDSSSTTTSRRRKRRNSFSGRLGHPKRHSTPSALGPGSYYNYRKNSTFIKRKLYGRRNSANSLFGVGFGSGDRRRSCSSKKFGTLPSWMISRPLKN